jgi:hypothetical protein
MAELPLAVVDTFDAIENLGYSSFTVSLKYG